MRTARLLTLIGAIVATPLGCAGGCKRDRPYVPFLDDSGASTQQDGEITVIDAPVDGPKAPTFVQVHATLPPPSTTHFELEGLTFDAPPGNVLVAAIAHDVDGDGQRDVVAYVQPAAGGGGEVRLHRGDGSGALAPSRVVAASDLVLPAPCLGKPAMTLVGPHTITLDLHPSCGDGAPAPRRFAVVAFAPTPSVRWSARVADPPIGWTLGIDVDALDRDGDGVDDPSFAFALDGGGPPYEPGDRIVAHLRYWDRPAGLSRDRTEPEASFQWIAAQASARATKKATAITVAALVRRLRLLHGAICAEAGAPWIDVGGEHGVGCGTSRGLEDAGAAEVRAALTQGDVLVAIAARERLAASVAMKTTKTRADIDKAIRAAAPSIAGVSKELRQVPSTPSRGAPAWGALAFEKGGTLLVRTLAGVARIDPLTLDDGDAPDVASWNWEVAYPSKDARLGAVVDACEAPYLVAKISGHDVPTGATLVPVPLLPALTASRCDGGRGAASLTTPVAWGGSGLYLLVDHEPVIVPAEFTTPSGARATGTIPAPAGKVDGEFVLGAPRSPSGSWLVVPTRFGVIRRDDSGAAPVTSLVWVKELEGLYTSLRECAIANDGAHIACVREGKVVLIDTTTPGMTGGDAGDEDGGG